MVLLLIDIVLVALALGVVQGISEWLPISSKTQILFVSVILLGLTLGEGYTLGLFLEGGTVIAAIIYFRREVWEVLKAIVGRGTPAGVAMLKYLVIATAITAVIAVPLYKFVVGNFTGPAVGLPMIVLGALLLVDWLLIKLSTRRHVPRKLLQDMSLREMAYVGVAQGISALPGVSRSGVTTSTMLFEGTKTDEAFRLSFLAGIPATIGAAGVTLIFGSTSIKSTIGIVTPLGLVIAIVVSTLISVFFIGKLIRFAGKSRMTSLLLILGLIAMASGVIVILTGLG